MLKSDYERSFRSEIKSIFPLSMVQSPPPLPTYPLIHKWGWGKRNFPKMAVMGDGKFFLKMERTRNGWFYNGKDGKFLISVYIVGRGPYIAYPPTPPLSQPIPHPQGSFCCPVSLAGWVITSHLIYFFT